jgi:hypothetical protein
MNQLRVISMVGYLSCGPFRCLSRLSLAILVMVLVFIRNVDAQTFADDFNRPDGTVDNGWTAFNGSMLINGQLETFGSNATGGGVYRSFPVTFPVSFDFDFRTESPHPSCDVGNLNHPGGGWLIAFNSPAAQNPAFYTGAQIMFYQYYGSQPIVRQYQTMGGQMGDAIPTGLPDFGSSFVHIAGTVNADFSATISVGGYSFTFPPAVGTIAPAPGAALVLSNSSCGDGPFFFDNLVVAPLYNICPLYDSTKAVHSGSTVPIKLQLCDASGNDMSSSGITVHATGLTQISTSTSGAVQDSGNSNPDNDFRFDPTLGTTGGYIFNLSTKGLTTGTYNLNFTVAGSSSVYSTQFQVKQ